MTTSNLNSREAPAVPAFKPNEPLVDRMFSGFGHVDGIRHATTPRPPEEPYHPLPQAKAGPGVVYRLKTQTSMLPVQASSPATDVMTDLSRVRAVTIAAGASIEGARQAMITHGVRALFVLDDAGALLGIVTANDIVGERPVQIGQNRGVRHADVLVGDVMTPASLLEAMELHDVLKVRVGDIVETLKQSGRQHALVIDTESADGTSAMRTIRGMFSLTQIGRQLGLPPEIGRDVARTLADIEAAMGTMR